MYLDNNNIIIIEPNICPHCHVTIKPIFKTLLKDTDKIRILTCWLCTNQDCENIFSAIYLKGSEEKHYYFERFLDGMPKGPEFPQPIKDLKDSLTLDEDNPKPSKFIKTYLQSLDAEANGLDELAGMGYRKSIEYLVKDWAIKNNPIEKDKILNMWLSGIISNYFKGDLKDILERATWLGNDQSHYNKLFEEYNINHLKELIDLIMVELDREAKKRHYIETIEKRK